MPTDVPPISPTTAGDPGKNLRIRTGLSVDQIATDGTDDSVDARIELRRKKDGREEWKVEVDHAAAGLLLDAWMEDDSGVITRIGPLEEQLSDRGVEYEIERKSDEGGLPFGATDLSELSGRKVEIRDADGNVLATGFVPSIAANTLSSGPDDDNSGSDDDDSGDDNSDSGSDDDDSDDDNSGSDDDDSDNDNSGSGSDDDNSDEPHRGGDHGPKVRGGEMHREIGEGLRRLDVAGSRGPSRPRTARRLPRCSEWASGARAGRDAVPQSDHRRRVRLQKIDHGPQVLRHEVGVDLGDLWHDSHEDAPTDGSLWVDEGSPDRVVRGGCFFNPAVVCRSANRDGDHPGFRYGILGFCPAFSLPGNRPAPGSSSPRELQRPTGGSSIAARPRMTVSSPSRSVRDASR